MSWKSVPKSPLKSAEKKCPEFFVCAATCGKGLCVAGQTPTTVGWRFSEDTQWRKVVPSTKVEKSPARSRKAQQPTKLVPLLSSVCSDWVDVLMGRLNNVPLTCLWYILKSIQTSLYPPYIIFHDWDVLSRYFLHSVKRRLTFKIYKTLLILLVLHPVFDTKMVVATLVWWRKEHDATCDWLRLEWQRIVTLKSSYRLIAH